MSAVISNSKRVFETPARLKAAFEELFKQESVPESAYRIFINRARVPDEFYAQLVWDGFDSIPYFSRSSWVWDRIEKIMPAELAHRLSQVICKTSVEFVCEDELRYQHETRERTPYFI